jgi:hypothetical protein
MLKEVLVLAVFSTTLLPHQVLSTDYSELELIVPNDLSVDDGARIKLIFPTSYSFHSQTFQELTLESLRAAVLRMETKIRDNFSIHFDPQILEHNGLTTVIPRNRISVNTEAPEIDSTIAFSDDYLKETLIHEFGHMLALQQRSGVFRPMSYLFGNSSRPIGLWPRWMHEGLAVWVEEASGGRPKSGSIARDLRLYQEYRERDPHFDLSSDDLDGDYETGAISGGRLPYSFGYLLVKDLLRRVSTPKLLKESSRSLGISFRPVLRSLHYDLDEEFPRLKKEWASVSLSSREDLWTPLAESRRIRGPYQRDTEVSWIESPSKESSKSLLVRLDSLKGPIRTKAPRNLGIIEAAYALSENEWILVTRLHPEELEGGFYNPNRNYIRRIGIWRAGEKQFRCRFPLSGKTREIAFHDDQLYWVETQSDGFEVLTRGLWNESCSLNGEEVVTRARFAFERITNPFARKDQIAWIQSENRNLLDSRIHFSDGREMGTEIRTDSPLSQPLLISPTKIVAIQHSQDHWGPVLIDSKTKTVKALPVKTSIRRIVFARDHLLGVREFWDHEEIVKLGIHEIPEALTPLPNILEAASLKKESSVPAAEVKSEVSENNTNTIPTPTTETKIENYRTIRELLPHFWSPIAGADGSGFFVAGSTFFSDVLQKYSGVATAGYSSITHRGFFLSALERNSQESFFHLSPKIGFSYTPRYIGYLKNETGAQNRLQGSASLLYPAQWKRSLYLTVSLGLSYEFQEKTFNYSEGRFWIPTLAMSLRSQDGQSRLRSPNTLVDAKKSFYLLGRVRRVAGLETEASVSIEHGLWKKAGSRWVGEMGWTSTHNYPFSYFIYGGQAIVNTQPTGDYLSRGYPYQTNVARRILRFAHESDFRILDSGFSLGWNRLKVKNVDLRLLAETLTRETVRGTHQLGEGFLNTVGAELRVFGKSLTYIDFETSLGYYMGLNPRSHQISLGLRALLDI